jgi:uncharacterized protein YwlG (UPF0340 family)
MMQKPTDSHITVSRSRPKKLAGERARPYSIYSEPRFD